MKTLSLLTAVVAFGLTLAVGDAEAKRLGGGKSSGMQRESVTADRAAPPAMAPGAARSQPAAAAAPQAQPKRSWMGPLAGLAAGLGLAALASHFGFGEELASMLMIALLVMAVLVVIGLIMRRCAAAPAAAGSGGLQYAAAGPDGPTSRRNFDEPALPASGAVASVAAAGNIPADFDAAAFERNAKVSFIRLQAANDAGNLDDLREFTTPEMFAELRMNIAERGTGMQTTDVVTIEAQVLDVIEEATRYVVSVRFSGLIREDKDAAAEPVDEIWHMVKPREGRGGWVLAGIQQLQ
ncbi:MAG: Tim44 domain-containing protein [Candidatus Accumulibacter sp.]|uniref:Tim44 domain-containing protein n=1 Tax=Accumulibacter sp. TaxID=2053492 RepID=UPI001A48DD55|nr:Tim44-like domain-containing protein [Accumulibacter sp.]MBL8396088.1 Tim44 domain-containing protein [Accumulibacter sp.]